MPWWSWILIWIALVALSLLFYVVLGVRLFRKFTTTLRELGEAADRFSRLPSPAVHGAGSATGGAGTTMENGVHEAPRPAPGDAVFASPARMRHAYLASKIARQNARRLRRIQRRRDRGQPQTLRDIELG